LIATISPPGASDNHTAKHKWNVMSPKAAIVILWACVIAGAAIASEKHRTNFEYQEHTSALQEMLKSHVRIKQKCGSLKRFT
jgi:hypothetical protein